MTSSGQLIDVCNVQGVLAIRGFVIRGFAIRGFLDGFKSSYFAVYPHNSRFFQSMKASKNAIFCKKLVSVVI